MINRREIYIASRRVKTNDYGIDIESFSKPQKYNFFYMPSKSDIDYQLYGRDIGEIFVCFVDYNRFLGKFKVEDRVYLIDNETTDLSFAESDINAENANYKIVSILPQNLKIKLTFAKIK